MKNKSLMAIIVLAIMLTFNGCKKDDDSSLQPRGNYPTIQNFSFTVHPTNWTYSNTYQQWYYNYYINVNGNSAVLGYVMSGNGEQILPYVETTSNFRVAMATDLFLTPSYIQFQYTNFNSVTTAPTNDVYLYLVVMPPSQRKAHPNVDYKNYQEVKKAFHLKD